MLPRLYNASASIGSYENNGLGFIKDCTKCEVTEELNGEYSLAMTVLSTDRLASSLAVNKIIKAKANSTDPPQLFEISKHIVKSNGEIEITAQHIKFLAMQNCISSEYSPVGWVVNGNPKTVANAIFDSLMFENIFTFSSDIATVKDYDLSDTPSKKLGDIFGGSDYSFLSEFGGDFHYNNFNIELLKRRGSDSGYRLMFSMNLSEYNQTATNDAAYSHFMGYAKVTRLDEEKGYIVLAGSPVQTSTSQVFPKVKKIDFSSQIREYFGSDWKVNPLTGYHYKDTVDMITFFTNEYFMKNIRGQTNGDVNITVNYEPEIDKMQNLKIGDTVKVCYGENSGSLTSRITKAVYDSLAERYKVFEVGEQKPTLLNFITKKRR